MQRTEIEEETLKACQRLGRKGFLNTPSDSFSVRIPGSMEMIVVSGCKDWRQIGIASLRNVSFSVEVTCGGLHAAIYQERADVGAVAISSPRGVRLLARCGGPLPALFDEQARHIGPSTEFLKDEENVPRHVLREALRKEANALLLGERLLCLGMTCERVLSNTELFEKCAQAFVIANASGHRIRVIPAWVRLIANRRLRRDERRAAASYRKGVTPEGIGGY